jgi:hypothetical protein
MKNNFIYKYLPSIFILLNMFVFSSCTIEADTNGGSKLSTINPLEGMYKTRGSMYNYNGKIAGGWLGPPLFLSLTDSLSVPPGYISRIDLSPFSPKTATVIDSVSITTPFANLLSPDYYYNWKMNTAYTSITFDFSPVMIAGYSNVNKFIRAFILAPATQKLSMRVITYYNDQPGGLGNDHIVDEVFEQL